MESDWHDRLLLASPASPNYSHGCDRRGTGIIDTVSDDDQSIEWHDKKEPAGTVSFDALGSRLGRARKALFRASG